MNWLGWSPAALLMLPQPTVAEAQGSAAVQPAAILSPQPSGIAGPLMPTLSADPNSASGGLAIQLSQPVLGPVAASVQVPILALPARPQVTVKRVSKSASELRALNDRIIARLEVTNANELFRPDQHLLAGSLTSGNSWRRQMDIKVALIESNAVGLSVTAAFFNGRQPLLVGRGTRHGFGELFRWREGNTVDLGMKVDLLNRRLRYSGGLSWSDYALTSTTRLVSPDQHLWPVPDWRRGRSQWSKIEADLWSSDEGSASAYVLFGSMDEAYRSLRRGSDSPLIYDGRTFEAGANLSLGATKLSLTHSALAGAYLALRETTGEFKGGPLKVEITNGVSALRNRTDVGWWNEDRYWKAKAKLSLRELLGTGGGTGLLPQSLSFSATRKSSLRSSFGTPSTRELTRVGFGLGWTGESSTTDVSLSRIVTSGVDLAGSHRGGGVFFDFNQSFSGRGWDVSFYGSLSNQRATRDSNRFYSGGISFSTSGKKFPKVSAGLDVNGYDSEFRATRLPVELSLLPLPAEQMAMTRFGTHSREIRLDASVDLSQYLPVTDPEHKPYLKIKAYGDWSREDDTGSGARSRLVPTIFLVVGRRL